MRRLLSILAGLLFATAAPAQTAEPLIIGVAAPLTGPYAPIGDFIVAGVEAAAADLTAAGGVLDRPLSVVTADDECTADGATAAANQLLGAGVVFTVGHVCYSATVAGGEVYAENGIVQITPATRAAALSERRPANSLFRLAPRADKQGVVAGEHLAGLEDARQIAILFDGSAYGKGLADTVKQTLNAAGRQESEFTEFAPSAEDYGPLAARLIDNATDAVFIGGSYQDVAAIAALLRAAGSEAVVITSDTAVNAEYPVLAGDGADGTLVVGPAQLPQSETAEAVAEAAGAKTDVARHYALAAYAAVEIWAAAVTARGTTDRRRVAAEIGTGPTETVLGAVAFSRLGDSLLPGYALYEWRDNALTPL